MEPGRHPVVGNEKEELETGPGLGAGLELGGHLVVGIVLETGPGLGAGLELGGHLVVGNEKEEGGFSWGQPLASG